VAAQARPAAAARRERRARLRLPAAAAAAAAAAALQRLEVVLRADLAHAGRRGPRRLRGGERGQVARERAVDHRARAQRRLQALQALHAARQLRAGRHGARAQLRLEPALGLVQLLRRLLRGLLQPRLELALRLLRARARWR